LGNYHVHQKLDIILQNQQAILDLLVLLDRKADEEMSDLSALTTEVENNTAVDSSAIELLNGLSLQLAALANNPVAIQALAAELAQSSAALANAVLANTPAAVEPPPVEPPVETPPVEAPVEPPPAVVTPEQPPLDSPPVSA
jgi:hypothetical protein